MAYSCLQNMASIRERGLDEYAVRSVIGITHLAGADTVSTIYRSLSPHDPEVSHRQTVC